MTFSVRPYQARARFDLYQGSAQDPWRTLLVLCPGGGKTFIAFLVVTDALKRSRPVWFFAHRRNLVEQTAGKFREYSGNALDPQVVMDGHAYDVAKPLRVASIQTLQERGITLEPNAVAIVDEPHISLIDDVIDANPTVWWIGLTGTPIRKNKRPMGRIWKRLVQGPAPSSLFRQGVLTSPRIHVPVIPADQSVADFCDERAIVGDPVDWWRRYASGHRTLTFARDKAHARAVVAEYAAGGIRSMALTDDDTDAGLRSRVLRMLERRELDAVVNVGLFREGTDLTWLECFHDLAPTDSVATFIQKSARLWRHDPTCVGKVHLDQVGNYYRHGNPTADREWSIDDAKRNGMLVAAPDFSVCAACGFLKASPGPCAHCGAAPPVRERRALTRAGEAAELTAAKERELNARRQIDAADKQARRQFQGIAFSRMRSGNLRLADVSRTAAHWFDQWKASGTPLRQFTRSLDAHDC